MGAPAACAGRGLAQSYLLPHHHLTEVANAYYIYGHFNMLIAMLAWVWLRHRQAYARLRLIIIVFTLMATAVQILPVAPPRLLPGHLVVDTPTVYGQSVYDAGGLGAVSQSRLCRPSTWAGRCCSPSPSSG